LTKLHKSAKDCYDFRLTLLRLRVAVVKPRNKGKNRGDVGLRTPIFQAFNPDKDEPA
jgi:hypothetical protein